jgi:hypothetical protein
VAKLRINLVPVVGTVIDVALEVAPEVCAALDPDSPGGRKLTDEEIAELVLELARELARRRGAGVDPLPAIRRLAGA